MCALQSRLLLIMYLQKRLRKNMYQEWKMPVTAVDNLLHYRY